MRPPGATCGANLRSEISFIATSTSGCEMSGEPMRSFDRQTWQCALPERISGP